MYCLCNNRVMEESTRQADLEEARASYSGSPGIYIRGLDLCLVYVGDVWFSGGEAIGRVVACGRIVSEEAYSTLAAADKAVRKAGRKLLPEIARYKADLIASVSDSE